MEISWKKEPQIENEMAIEALFRAESGCFDFVVGWGFLSWMVKIIKSSFYLQMISSMLKG